MKEFAKKNLRAFGFDEQVDRVENNQCPICGSKKTNPEDFRDDLSRREYSISGMCQSCQDGIFGMGDE